MSQLREALDGHPKRDDLSKLVRTAALSAANERHLRFGDGLDELMADAGLSQQDGAIGALDALALLRQSEPPAIEGRTLIALLLARGLAADSPADDDAKRVAGQLCWLAANSWLDALWALDEGLPAVAAATLWNGIAAHVRACDEGGSPRGRGEALAAIAALKVSASEAAVAQCAALEGQLTDPLLAALLAAEVARPSSSPAVEAPAPPLETTSLSGEIVPVPLGPIGLILWTVTGLIVVRYLLRFIANVVLRLRRPTELTVDAQGVTVAAKLDLMGRTIRSRNVRIPKDNLAAAIREVRYPRLALYTGLLALAVGTYIGASLIVDGTRAGSPSLLGIGAAIFGVGVALDLIFANLIPAGRGQHRLVFVQRSGRTVAIATTDDAAADEALQRLV